MKHLESCDFLSTELISLMADEFCEAALPPSVTMTAGLICSFQTLRTFPKAVIYKLIVLQKDNGLRWHYATAEQIRLCSISSAVTHVAIANTERYVRPDNVLLHHCVISPTITSHGSGMLPPLLFEAVLCLCCN